MSAEQTPHGWLVIDKPQGMSSQRAVAIVRHRLGAKAGHAGTLDPLATGVLPVALGEATKTVRYLMSAGKGYRFRIRWGVARATEDGEGDIVALCAVRPSAAAIEAVLPQFTGAIRQRPPAHSAVKVGGRRAYALARLGAPPHLPARPVEVKTLRLVAMPDADHADFTAEVGKGTYIRALARDLAAALGTVGHVAALRRVAVGAFTLAQAISTECLTPPWSDGPWSDAPGGDPADHVLPIGMALGDLPAVDVSTAEAARLRCGQRVAPAGEAARERLDSLAEGGEVGAWRGRDLVAIARIENRGLKPMRVINL